MLYIIVIFLTLSFSGCDDIFHSERSQTDQQVYFQYEYINYAWGYQHAGWLIDSAGKVYCYHAPENWNFADTAGYIDATAMEATISSMDSVCLEIDTGDLDDKIQLIENASTGIFSDPEYAGADAGTMSYYAFIYEKKKDRYKRFLLRQNGDIQINNTSKAAEDLYEWMASLHEDIGL